MQCQGSGRGLPSVKLERVTVEVQESSSPHTGNLGGGWGEFCGLHL